MPNPPFRCAGCGQPARLLFADRANRLWCSKCDPSDPGATVGPPKPPSPDSDMPNALAVTRARALFGFSGLVRDLRTLIAAERTGLS